LPLAYEHQGKNGNRQVVGRAVLVSECSAEEFALLKLPTY